MSVASEQLDSAAQRAAAERLSYSHFLGYLLHGELKHRHRRTVETNLRFPYLKRLADFDFSAPLRANINEAHQLCPLHSEGAEVAGHGDDSQRTRTARERNARQAEAAQKGGKPQH